MDKINSIINDITIEQESIRNILNNGLIYEYLNTDIPIEFNEQNLKRIIVNSIRHNYSNYEYGLRQIHRLHVSEDIYFIYKSNILNKISNNYPFLKDECDKQKHLVNMVNLVR